MTLDEAIAKAKEDGDVQLAEWLRQARGADIAARWYTKKLREIKAENAKLQELVRSVLVIRHDPVYKWLDATFAVVFGKSFTKQARELGVEVDE